MLRLSVFYFILYSSFAVILMFFPLYLQSQGLGMDKVGFIMAMGSVISVIGQPVLGYISDKVKSTKKVLLFVMVAAFVFSFFLFAVETFLSLLMLFTLFMFFMSSCGPLTDNISMQYARAYKKNYGAMRSFGSVGVGTSSLVLGFVIGAVGVQYLGWMYASIMILAIPLVLLVYENRSEQTNSNIPSISITSVKRLVLNKKYMWVVGVSFLILTPHKMNDSLLTIYLSHLGAKEHHIGLAWMLATFSSVPLFILTGVLLKYHHELVLMMIAAFFYSIRWFMYGFWDHPQALTYLQLLQGVTFPVFFVAVLHYVTKLIPKELVATGHLLFIAGTMGMGGLLGNAGGGWYMEHFSPQAAYHLGGWFCFIGTLSILFAMMRSRKISSEKSQAM